MGYTSYSCDTRFDRAASLGYSSGSINTIFQQQSARQIHESMDPKRVVVRESRDSETHPNSVPILVALDLTGSMHSIPMNLVKDGLPTMMGTLTQKGVPDASLLFIGVGDHECDRFPLQVGQFESGDAELDMWLTRTYLEGGGGANAGESYLLAWYFAANHTITDAWEKRKQKGYIFTIGDEPCLNNLPKAAIKSFMAEAVMQSSNSTKEELLAAAQEKYNVYHLHVTHSEGARRSLQAWKNLLGQSCIEVSDYTQIPKIIAEIVMTNNPKRDVLQIVTEGIPISESSPKDEEIL